MFSEDQGYDEAQAFASAILAQLELAVTNRIDGPDVWIWDAQNEEGTFIIGYDDFPCETTLWAADPASDRAVTVLFARLTNRPPGVA